ncbi:MAG: hypothetical protein NWE89_16275 [Candidatus Bathyarchaeota archaeon]|nr:hypothetical protein [Candidatus Bathyarchaeota archaeon]
MPVPTPRSNEEKDDFIPRCVSFLVNEGTDQEQAVAICLGKWGDSRKAEADDGIELTFMAAVHSIKSEEDRLATFYIMNTSLNRNGWKVTEEALKAALPSLLGKALGCIPGYRVNHVHEALKVGKWVKVDGRDSYALATAEITDDVAWGKLTSGEWGPVSVVISAYRVVCSKCGGDITNEPCEHIKDKTGHEIIESFTFKRVDFVGTPAYPQAAIITLDELTGALSARSRMASLGGVDSQSTGQAPGSLLNPDEKRKKQAMSELEELRDEFKTLKAENEQLQKDFDEFKANAEKPTDDPEDKPEKNPAMETVQAELKEIKDERHAERVAAAFDARKKAGMVTDETAELERLSKLDDFNLSFLLEDAVRVAKKLEKARTPGPRAAYTKDQITDFEAAVETGRRRLGLSPMSEEVEWR